MTVPPRSTPVPSSPEPELDVRWTGPLLTESTESGRETLPDLGPEHLPPGTILDGRYEIGELLGQGGMGYVVAARHVVLGKRVAIKVLKPELTSEPEMAERFRLEARAASSIGHPIVDVSDFGELPRSVGHARASYFVMEHLEGESLAGRLEREGALPIASAADIARQMASGLHAAHLAGIVHRDVKPENVILTTRAGRLDHVKLLDFGIAKLESSRRDTGRSLVLGTPAYMAPEQARGQSLDARADVYALGVVLFELLAGRLPFLDDVHPLFLVRRHATEPVPPIGELRSEIPLPLAELVTEMLAKHPAQRPRSMEEVSERLAPFASSSHVVVTRPGPMPLVIPAISSGGPSDGPSFSRPRAPVIEATTPAEAPKPRLRVEWIAALGLVLAVAIVGAIGAGFLARRSEGPRITPTAQSLPAIAPRETEERVPETPTAAPSAPSALPRVAATSELAVSPAPARRASLVSSPAPTLEAAPTGTPSAPVEAPTRPPTFGEQNLLDPWE